MAKRAQEKPGGEKTHELAEPSQQAPASDEVRGTSDIPLLEWIVGGVGFLLITSVIAFLLYHAITGMDSPPDVSVSIVAIRQNRSGYLVRVKARNDGGSTAEGVVIQGELKKGSQVLERSETTLDYSPPGSEKEFGLFFTRDPRQFELHIRPLGYEKP
ncbi:MAG TPA: TIGR02588 family protein [Candidatus Binatia bacterium]|nr:TIGR02588 family protein [Candidatus Binatia bacterium]